MRSALNAGAVEYLEKTVTSDELLDAIGQVAWGKTVLEPRVLKVFADGPRETVLVDPLTPWDQEVLQALGQGMSNKGIAEQLHIAGKTVKVHMNHIFPNLNLRPYSSSINGYTNWFLNARNVAGLAGTSTIQVEQVAIKLS